MHEWLLLLLMIVYPQVSGKTETHWISCVNAFDLKHTSVEEPQLTAHGESNTWNTHSIQKRCKIECNLLKKKKLKYTEHESEDDDQVLLCNCIATMTIINPKKGRIHSFWINCNTVRILHQSSPCPLSCYRTIAGQTQSNENPSPRRQWSHVAIPCAVLTAKSCRPKSIEVAMQYLKEMHIYIHQWKWTKKGKVE